MGNVLESLKLIEIEKICLHEAHEFARLLETSRAIQQDGMLRNPMLAVQMSDGRYLIIDGAHRTGSLQYIGCTHVPVQVVGEADFTLEAWYHVVPVGAWIEKLKQDPSLRFVRNEKPARPLAEMVEADGSLSWIEGDHESDDPSVRLMGWHKIVASYSGECSVNRVAPSRAHGLVLEANTVLMRYPACSLYELEEVVLAGKVVPAGVTRFTVPGRLLNLRIPLHLLTEESFDEAEWERLQVQWNNSLRLYSEAVYFCEA